MNRHKKNSPHRRALSSSFKVLPDAVCAAAVGVCAGIIGLPAAVSVILRVGAVRIIRVAVSAVGEVINISIAGMIHITAVQVVGQTGAVIVEGGVAAVVIVHVVLQIPVLIIAVAAIRCAIRDVIGRSGVVSRGGINRGRGDIQESHGRICGAIVVIEGADHAVAVHLSAEVPDREVRAVLARDSHIREAVSEFLGIEEGSVRSHKFPFSRVVVIRTGDKPGGTAGAADFIGRVLGDRYAGIGKSRAAKRQEQHEDQSDRDDFFHFSLSLFVRLYFLLD